MRTFAMLCSLFYRGVMKTFYAKGRKLTLEITEYFKGKVSYSLANKLIRKKDVKVNGVRVK